MAKLNIAFDDKIYSIEYSDFSVPASNLSLHLSTVMNGSGAEIDLNGTSYNVDSTKLANATSNFITHLGTVSGSGKKVVINGVEYSIDSNKMTKAVTDLHTVLSGENLDPALNPSGIIPEGGTYYVAACGDGHLYSTNRVGDYDKATAIYTSGQPFPSVATDGDKYVYGGYEYAYGKYVASTNNPYEWYCDEDFQTNNCWSVLRLSDFENETVAPPILERINGVPVALMRYTFMSGFDHDCAVAPAVIPKTVADMSHAFDDNSITTAPEIPEGVINMEYAFYSCNNLTAAPVIPSTVTNMTNAFFGTAIITAPEIPEGVINMESAFSSCTKLTTPPSIIPSTVTNMKNAFAGCSALETTPKISAEVTNLDMDHAFAYDSSLKRVHTIPEGVISLRYTFAWCSRLSGTIEINAEPTSYVSCFAGVDMSNVTLTGSSSLLDELGATGQYYAPKS